MGMTGGKFGLVDQCLKSWILLRRFVRGKKICHWVVHVCPVPGRVKIKKEDCGGDLGGSFTTAKVFCT